MLTYLEHLAQNPETTLPPISESMLDQFRWKLEYEATQQPLDVLGVYLLYTWDIWMQAQ